MTELNEGLPDPSLVVELVLDGVRNVRLQRGSVKFSDAAPHVWSGILDDIEPETSVTGPLHFVMMFICAVPSEPKAETKGNQG